jgi:hypothetical protein
LRRKKGRKRLAKAVPRRMRLRISRTPCCPRSINAAVCSHAIPAIDGEDLLQEALPKALPGFATYESGTNFKEWLSDPSIVATWNVANVVQIANAIDAPDGAVDDIVTNSTQKIGTTFFVEPKPDGFNIRNASYSPLWQVSMAT